MKRHECTETNNCSKYCRTYYFRCGRPMQLRCQQLDPEAVSTPRGSRSRLRHQNFDNLFGSASLKAILIPLQFYFAASAQERRPSPLLVSRCAIIDSRTSSVGLTTSIFHLLAQPQDEDTKNPIHRWDHQQVAEHQQYLAEGDILARSCRSRVSQNVGQLKVRLLCDHTRSAKTSTYHRYLPTNTGSSALTVWYVSSSIMTSSDSQKKLQHLFQRHHRSRYTQNSSVTFANAFMKCVDDRSRRHCRCSVSFLPAPGRTTNIIMYSGDVLSPTVPFYASVSKTGIVKGSCDVVSHTGGVCFCNPTPELRGASWARVAAKLSRALE